MVATSLLSDRARLNPAVVGMAEVLSVLRSGLLSAGGSVLSAGGTSTAAESHLILAQQPMDESIGPAVGAGELADAAALLVLLADFGCQLRSIGTRDPGALLQIGHCRTSPSWKNAVG
jgi:hypothetical protein